MNRRPPLLMFAVAAVLMVSGAVTARQDPAVERLAQVEAELQRIRDEQGDVDSFEVAVQTGVLASARNGVGDPTGALEAYQEALQMARRLGLGDHALTQVLHHSLGGSYATLGRADEAVAAHEDAIAMARRLQPGDHETTAESLRSMGNSLLFLERYAEAEPPLRDALAMTLRLSASDRTLELAVRQNLMTCLFWLGRPEEGLLEEEVIVEIHRQSLPPGDPKLAAVLDTYADDLQHLVYAERALHARTEALEILRGVHPGDDPAVVAMLMKTASDVARLRRNGEACAIFEDALAMAERLFKGDHPMVAAALNGLAWGWERSGDAAGALPHFEAALAMRRRLFGDEHPLIAQSITNLAYCLVRIGRAEDAIDMHRDALAMRRRLSPGDNPEVANSLLNLAAALKSTNHADEALPLCEEHAAMVARLYGEQGPLAVDAWEELAGCLGQLGREEEALELYERSVDTTRRIFGDQSPEYARSLNGVAVSLANLGRIDEALPLLEQALTIERGLETGEGLEVSLMNVAHLLLLNQRPAEAAERYAEMIGNIEARRAAASGLLERDRTRYFAYLRRGNPYAGMVAAQVALGRTDEALRYLEQGRSRTLLDLMERRRIDPFAEALRVAEQRGDAPAKQVLMEVSASLDRARTAVEQTTYALATTQNDSAVDPKTRAAKMSEIDAARQTALQQEREAHRARARAVQNQLPLGRPAPPEQIRQLPGPGELLVAFALTEKSSSLFLIPPAGAGDIGVFDLEIQSAALQRSVDDLLDKWSRPKDPLDRGVAPPLLDDTETAGQRSIPTEELSHDLFRALFPEDSWPQVVAASRIYVLPDGPLHDLPLETLTVGFEGDAPRYWIDVGPPVSYAPSATVLLACRSNRDARRAERMPLEVLALGDPEYGAVERDVTVPESGALIAGVSVNSSAERSGLRVGDVIIRYDDAPVEDDRTLRACIQELGNAIEDGDADATTTPTLVLVRDGEELAVQVPAGPLGVSVARGAAGEAVRQGLAPGEPTATVERAGMLLRYGDLAPLPGTRRELAAIYESFTGKRFDPRTTAADDSVLLLLGKDANEAELFRQAPKARIMHLAAHYLADDSEYATRSALAFTLPSTPSAQDDGFLSVGDVMERWRGRLDGCELVVLSACETARGEHHSHEGVFAMPWGLFYAGVPAVIVSHWRVSDDSTAELMAEFYHLLREEPGISKLSAFTRARQAIRARYPTPFHWAPFVYLGDPR